MKTLEKNKEYCQNNLEEPSFQNKNEKKVIYCPNCSEKVSFHIKKEKEKINVLGKSFFIEIENPYCDECGQLLDVPEVEKRNSLLINDIYKKKVGLLTSSEIVAIRKGYGLTAVAFSKLLGVGEKTITRYENGGIQDQVYDRLIRLLADKQVFSTFYNENKKSLSFKEARAVNKVLSNKNSIDETHLSRFERTLPSSIQIEHSIHYTGAPDANDYSYKVISKNDTKEEVGINFDKLLGKKVVLNGK